MVHKVRGRPGSAISRRLRKAARSVVTNRCGCVVFVRALCAIRRPGAPTRSSDLAGGYRQKAQPHASFTVPRRHLIAGRARCRYAEADLYATVLVWPNVTIIATTAGQLRQSRGRRTRTRGEVDRSAAGLTLVSTKEPGRSPAPRGGAPYDWFGGPAAWFLENGARTARAWPWWVNGTLWGSWIAFREKKAGAMARESTENWRPWMRRDFALRRPGRLRTALHPAEFRNERRRSTGPRLMVVQTG